MPRSRGADGQGLRSPAVAEIARTFRRGWHRDIRIPRDLGHEKLPLVGIKVCYCLTDFQQPNCGMTLMARGTHLRTEPLKIAKGEVDPIGVEGLADVFHQRALDVAIGRRRATLDHLQE